MKKPVHRFAFVLWVVAGAFLIVEVALFFGLPHRNSTDPNVILYNYWLTFRSAVTVSLQLAALGLLIEMADRIWWRGLSPEERAGQASSPSLVSALRRWPNGPEA